MSDHPVQKVRTVRVVRREDTPEALMIHTPVATIKSILGRLGIEYSHGLPKEVYVTALNDVLRKQKDLVSMMVPEYMIDYLFSLWDEDEVCLDEEYRNYLEYLRILGFAAFSPGGKKKEEEDHILVSQSRKEDFYFLLRSRSAREEMQTWSRWEKLITGMMYYYGFIEMRDLYDQFLRVSSQVVPYELFVRFIKCRCSLWAFGEILKDINRNIDYFSWAEVDNRETLLLFMREHADLPFKSIDPEDLIYLSEGAGIDNRWPGIGGLGTLLIKQMEMDYYHATVHIRTLIRMIHNGSTPEKLLESGDKLPLNSPDLIGEYDKQVRLLYDHVPVFEYKGHSHSEYRRISYEKQLKKKTALFTIIDGGRDSV